MKEYQKGAAVLAALFIAPGAERYVLLSQSALVPGQGKASSARLKPGKRGQGIFLYN